MANVQINGLVNDGGVTKLKTPNEINDSLVARASIVPVNSGVLNLGSSLLQFNDGHFSSGFYKSGVYQGFATIANATGTVDHNLNDGHAFIHENITSNFTVNVTNATFPEGQYVVIELYLVQGATPRTVENLLIGGVPQTIEWVGGMLPMVNANVLNTVSFQIFNTGKGNYIVAGR